MKFLKSVLLLMVLILGVGINANAEIIELAHKAGFYGCDSAINTQFSHYINSNSGRIISDYFIKNGQTFSLLASWGVSGDTVVQKTVFEKTTTKCFAYQISIITTNKSCMAYKEENPAWKYVQSQGDVTWTKNGGGVVGLLKTIPSGCEIVYSLQLSYATDVVEPPMQSKKKSK